MAWCRYNPRKIIKPVRIMKNSQFAARIIFSRLIIAVAAAVVLCNVARSSAGDDFLGPQSQRAAGEQRLLIVAVRFPDVKPNMQLQDIRKKATMGLNNYVQEQSYGRTWLKTDFRGWVMLPDPLDRYSVSPNNFDVDRRRVRKLVEDTMTALEKELDFSRYDNILIMPGVHTLPGKGYGMMCYCANPGMLTGVRGNPRFVTLRSQSGKEFSGGVFVGTINAPLGMLAHDFFHALGGIYQNTRLVPCLYNFERQAEASRRHEWEYCTNYMGPWDVMSSHYVRPDSPPPGISSFTKIRLGWITTEQVELIRPGESRFVTLSPLEMKGKTLSVKIPLEGGLYYLLENRQPAGYDKVLPDSGILVVRINPAAVEGTGTATIMDASPGTPNLSEATFKQDHAGRDMFTDPRNNIVVIPLWPEKENLEVLVTSSDKGEIALRAAQGIRELMERHKAGDRLLLKECLDLFKNFDFNSCLQRLQRL